MGARGFWVLWALLLVGQCWCDDGLVSEKLVVVVGTGECVDCAQQNIKNSDAFSGLQVAINCKASNGEMKTKSISKLDKDGKFQAELPSDLVNNKGELKGDCFAQLQSASQEPCPSQNTKLVVKSKDQGKYTFTPLGKLSFTPSICTSEFLWPFFKHWPFPKLNYKPLPKFKPKFHLPHHELPKVPLPHIHKKPPIVHKPPIVPYVPKVPPMDEKPHPHLIPKYPIIHKKPLLHKIPKIPIIHKKPLPHKPYFPPTLKP